MRKITKAIVQRSLRDYAAKTPIAYPQVIANSRELSFAVLGKIFTSEAGTKDKEVIFAIAPPIIATQIANAID